MGVSSIDVTLFRKMVMNGAINLKNNQEEVNQLNVFPVPDGDTGTNMSMTITSGVNEMTNSESSSIIDVAKVLSRGALMGARGNSGVILSQFFRGVYVGLKENTTNELDKFGLLKCFESGRKIAFKAVTEPVEGTILTVIRESYEKVNAMIDEIEDVEDLMRKYLEFAKDTLAHTPDLLPVLKEAGVVDSGGAGFVSFVEGMNLAVKGEILEAESDENREVSADELKYFYQMELLLELKKPEAFEIKALNGALSLLGDKVHLNKENEDIKITLNTDRPGRALEICQKYGEFIVLKIENLKAKKKEETTEAPQEMKEMALVSCCFGEGIIEIFRELGVDYVIEGGQTMNPSTADILDAVDKVNADTVIVLPNNKNIILAANQAAIMSEDNADGKKIVVVPSKTVPQGITAIINYVPETPVDDVVAAMTESLTTVNTGEVTYAVRDTKIDDVEIKQGDYMGIGDAGILAVGGEIADVTFDMLDKMMSEDRELISIYYGSDVDEKEADALRSRVGEKFPQCDVELQFGGQPIYYYIVSAE